MSKEQLPFHANDVASLARSLRQQLDALDATPSHVQMLNLLTKAVGYRNYQHFRAQEQARQELAAPRSVPRPKPQQVDYKRVRRVARYFDDQGRLTRWPGKFSQRMLCLWALWARLAPRTGYTEREISECLDTLHLFGDHALLRRELVDRGMMERTPDGREYKRLEVRPPDEAVELLRHLRG